MRHPYNLLENKIASTLIKACGVENNSAGGRLGGWWMSVGGGGGLRQCLPRLPDARLVFFCAPLFELPRGTIRPHRAEAKAARNWRRVGGKSAGDFAGVMKDNLLNIYCRFACMHGFRGWVGGWV